MSLERVRGADVGGLSAHDDAPKRRECARASMGARVESRVEDSRRDGWASVFRRYESIILYARPSSRLIASPRRVESSALARHHTFKIDQYRSTRLARSFIGRLSVRDLRRRRLHDDNLRLSPDTTAGAGVRHGRRRRLSIVHLPTHLALQAAAEERAR